MSITVTFFYSLEQNKSVTLSGTRQVNLAVTHWPDKTYSLEVTPSIVWDPLHVIIEDQKTDAGDKYFGFLGYQNGNLMKEHWYIRKAVKEDSIDLQKCMEAAYATYQSRMDGVRLPPMDVDYSKEIRDFPTWVAECKNVIVGGLIMIFENEYASIANIAVSPEFQGKGLGGGLMKYAENKAKEMEYSYLRLATHVLLIENISLYLHLGWTEIERDDIRVYFKKKV